MNEKKIWEEAHGNGYTNKVFSLLDSKLVLDKFQQELLHFRNDVDCIKVLIPGCGSNVNLQLCCDKVFGEKVVIYALDWSKEAIEKSKEKTNSLGIHVNYLNQSYYDLKIEPSFFDIIIMSNAIVSDSYENNVAAIANLIGVLKSGGTLLGLLPSPFNMLDYALTNSDAREWLVDGTVNVNERRIYEKNFSNQRFFSPLELYILLKKNNCIIDKFELFFYDDDDFAKQISNLYKIRYNNDYCFWGYFINVKKK